MWLICYNMPVGCKNCFTKKKKNNKIKSDSLLLILTENDMSGGTAAIGEICNVIFPTRPAKSAKRNTAKFYRHTLSLKNCILIQGE